MPKVNKELLKGFIQEGFFNNEKTNQQVIDKLDSRGFTIKGRKKEILGIF